MEASNAVRHGWVLANDLRLHHLDYGAPGRPIVCLHGVTGNAFGWHDVAAGLSDVGAVVALDMRGHGDSQWSPGRAYSSADHAEDLAVRVDELGADRVDLVGSSWGALVAIAFAAKNPSRIRRLAIIDVEASFEQDETELFPRPHSYASHADAVAFERQGNPHAPDALLEIVAASTTRSSPDGSLVPKHDPHFFERWPFRSDDVWGLLPSLTMPTLLVHAEASFVRCEVMQRMDAAIPDSRLVHLPDTTHVVPVDNPTGLVAHLAPFLGDD